MNELRGQREGAMDAAPLKWFGSKVRLAGWIVEHLPPHHLYCEPFGGSMAVLLKKPPSAIECFNDVDQELVGFWRVVRDPELLDRLCLRLSLAPYARAEWSWAADTYADCVDPVERAARWWTFRAQTFSAGGNNGRAPGWLGIRAFTEQSRDGQHGGKISGAHRRARCCAPAPAQLAN